MTYIILAIFLIWYISIVLEHNIKMNKTKWALFFWALAWILIFIYAYLHWHTHETLEIFDEILLEITKLSLFLISAMTILSYLSERKVLEHLAHKIIAKNNF
jgi:Na+/H+ antiporter NhaD/arsenite permease-like protein